MISRTRTLLDWAPGILLGATAVVLLTNGASSSALLVGVCSGFCLGVASRLGQRG